MLPLNRKLLDIEKERDERRKVRRKTKAKKQEDAAVAAVSGPQATAAASTSAARPDTSGDVTMGDAPTEQVAGVVEDETTARARELKTLTELVHPDLAADIGCSPHGLYELCGMS